MNRGSYREYFVRVGKEPDLLQQGLKSAYVMALAKQTPIPCGTIRRERIKGKIVMRIVIGHPTEELNWAKQVSVMSNMFETCEVEGVDFKMIEVPKENSIHRMPMHVLQTLISARRTGSSIASSGTEDVDTINKQAETRTHDSNFDSSSIHSLISGDQDGRVIMNIPTPPRWRQAVREIVITRGQQTVALNTGDLFDWSKQTVATLFYGDYGLDGPQLYAIMRYMLTSEHSLILADMIDTGCLFVEKYFDQVPRYRVPVVVAWIQENLLEQY